MCIVGLLINRLMPQSPPCVVAVAWQCSFAKKHTNVFLFRVFRTSNTYTKRVIFVSRTIMWATQVAQGRWGKWGHAGQNE